MRYTETEFNILSSSIKGLLWPTFLTASLLLVAFGFFRYQRNRTFKFLRAFPGYFEDVPLWRQISVHLSLSKSAQETAVPYGVHMFQAMTGITSGHQQHGQGAIVSYVAGKPHFLLFRADHVEELLNQSVNITKGSGYRFLEPWVGKSLLTSTGNQWKSQRKMLTPSFHFRILDDFCKTINKHAKIFADKMLVKKRDQNLVPFVSALSLDIVCETVMGVDMDSQNSPDGLFYLKSITKLEELLLKRAQNPPQWIDFIYHLTDSYRQFSALISAIHKFADKVIAERKSELLERERNKLNFDEQETCHRNKKPFLDSLISKHLNGEISLEEMNDQVNAFMFGGHDTISMTITFAIYLIGLHPEVQRKIQQEVDNVFLFEEADCDVMPEHLKSLKYMEMVIKESQRLYPVIPLIARKLDYDMTIAEKCIPKGTDINILLYSLHHDPKVFPKPDEFIPERFSLEEIKKRSPFAFIPFSAGPRNCIGQKFALREQKIVLTWLLRRYNWKSLDPRDSLQLGNELVLRPKNKIRVIFRKRKH